MDRKVVDEGKKLILREKVSEKGTMGWREKIQGIEERYVEGQILIGRQPVGPQSDSGLVLRN